MKESQHCEELREVKLAQITVNPFQPRRQFSQDDLKELADSIISVGLIHPPVVRPCGNDKFELVSGERRFRASQLAGLTVIPVIIRKHTNALSAQAALIENIQRVDLNPIEIAKSLRNLSDEFKWNQEELAHRIGKKRSTVANYMRLLALPQNIQESLLNEQITMGHAKAILSVIGIEKQNTLHNLVLQDGLSVRETEKAAEKLVNLDKTAPLSETSYDVHLAELVEKLQQKLGTRVTIQSKGSSQGRMCIDYYSLDDLDRVLGIFNID